MPQKRIEIHRINKETCNFCGDEAEYRIMGLKPMALAMELCGGCLHHFHMEVHRTQNVSKTERD